MLSCKQWTKSRNCCPPVPSVTWQCKGPVRQHLQLTSLPCKQTRIGLGKGRYYFLCVKRSHSKHFITKGVKASGQFRDLIATCFGTGKIVVYFRTVGTVACSKEMLNRLVNTAVSCPEQYLRTLSGTLSGPLALLRLICLRVLLTSCKFSPSAHDGASYSVSFVTGWLLFLSTHTEKWFRLSGKY